MRVFQPDRGYSAACDSHCESDCDCDSNRAPLVVAEAKSQIWPALRKCVTCNNNNAAAAAAPTKRIKHEINFRVPASRRSQEVLQVKVNGFLLDLSRHNSADKFNCFSKRAH